LVRMLHPHINVTLCAHIGQGLMWCQQAIFVFDRADSTTEYERADLKSPVKTSGMPQVPLNAL